MSSAEQVPPARNFAPNSTAAAVCLAAPKVSASFSSETGLPAWAMYRAQANPDSEASTPSITLDLMLSSRAIIQSAIVLPSALAGRVLVAASALSAAVTALRSAALRTGSHPASGCGT